MYVISTTKRPVPLEHYLWANDEMYKIVDGKTGTFLSLGYRGAVDSFKKDVAGKVLNHIILLFFFFFFL